MTVNDLQAKRIMTRAKINAIPHMPGTHQRHIALARIMSRAIYGDCMAAIAVYDRAMKRAGDDVFSTWRAILREDAQPSRLTHQVISIMIDVYNKRCAVTGNLPLDEMETIAHGDHAPRVTIAQRIREKAITHDET